MSNGLQVGSDATDFARENTLPENRYWVASKGGGANDQMGILR